MALLCQDVGEVKILSDLLAATGGNWTYKLFQNNVTPAESDTAGTYTVSTFTGYSDKTATRTVAGGTWGTPSTSGGVTSSTYGTTFSWSPTSSQTVYGYYVIDASATTLLFSELFASAKNLTSGDTLNLTGKIQID